MPALTLLCSAAWATNAGATTKWCLALSILNLFLDSGRVDGRVIRGPSAQMFQQIRVDLEPYVMSGISKAMIEGVYCGIQDGGFRVQIKDNRIYIVGEFVGIQSRNRNIKLQLLRLAVRHPSLPEVDFVVGTGDCPAVAIRNVSGMPTGGPVFVQAKKKEHTTAILYPDHTFTDWQEASAESWEHEQIFMQQAASDHPWGTKVPQLLFRGNSVTRNGKIAEELQPSNELDVRVWDWIQNKDGFMALSEHCKNRYLLNWPGYSYSARYKYLLLCGSVVLHSDNGYYEFFYPMLNHKKNVIKVGSLASKHDLEVGLATLIKQLEANPAQSRQIAEAGQYFAANILTADNLTEYWYRLLKSYAALQTDSVDLHRNAVPLHDSLANPDFVDGKGRSGCDQ